MFASSRTFKSALTHSSLISRRAPLRPRGSQQWRLLSNHSGTTSQEIPADPTSSSSSSSVSSPSSSPSSPSSSAPHTSLSTFLSYARQTHLSPTSTVYVGTRYEYLAQSSLTSLGFSLVRSGGRSDGGIDLYGTWTLPSEAPTKTELRCIVQCKALSTKKAGPNLVRELEGAFASAKPGWQGDDVIGVLVAPREASKGVREAVRRSRKGVLWVMLQDQYLNQDGEQDEDAEVSGRICQVLWNERVAELGATGVGVGLVYGNDESQAQSQDATGNVQREVRLMWKGQVWEPDLKSVE